MNVGPDERHCAGFDRHTCRYLNAFKFNVAISNDCCPRALLLSQGDGWLLNKV
jgi:hypothetical protein